MTVVLASFAYTVEDVDIALIDEGKNPDAYTLERKQSIASVAMDWLTEECHKALRDSVRADEEAEGE